MTDGPLRGNSWWIHPPWVLAQQRWQRTIGRLRRAGGHDEGQESLGALADGPFCQAAVPAETAARA